MKVVLFCGGFGMRLREHAENIPKPLVKVGHRPIMWHVMKYYAHFGHTDFILCLGWKGDVIKDYFLNYNECASNDFVLSPGGKVELLGSDVADWRITFVDTGIDANVGQRLRAVRTHLQDEEVFLANYADGLSDVPLPRLIRHFQRHQATAAFVAVRPHQSWHAVDMDGDGTVQDIQPISDGNIWMNGGFFVLNQQIFDVLEEGDELVNEPFRRLIDQRKLLAFKYDGFWSCMDTYKDKQRLEDLVSKGETPWELWNEPVAPCENDLADSQVLPLADGILTPPWERNRPR